MTRLEEQIRASEAPQLEVSPQQQAERAARRAAMAREFEREALRTAGHLIDHAKLVSQFGTPEARSILQEYLGEMDKMQALLADLRIVPLASGARAALEKAGLFDVTDITEDGFRRVFLEHRDPDLLDAIVIGIDNKIKGRLEAKATPVIQGIIAEALAELETYAKAVSTEFLNAAKRFGLPQSAASAPVLRAIHVEIEDLKPLLTAPVSVANHFSPRLSLSRFFEQPL